MEGERITIAAARGRRTAHLEGGSTTKSVDWALPTIFMAESIDPDFRPVDPATIAGMLGKERSMLQRNYTKELRRELQRLEDFARRVTDE